MNPLVKRAIKCALLASATAASSINAQEQVPTDNTIDTIYVTGSAIRRIDAEQSLPVQIFDEHTLGHARISSHLSR